MLDQLWGILAAANEILLAIVTFSLGIAILVAAWMYLADITQQRHAIRRNFPVIGRFRYWFEHLGEFFRQYFFAQDREEMPFNRAQRSWVYRAAKNIDNTIAFGSTRDLRPTGTVFFANTPFPALSDQEHATAQQVIGPYANQPYETNSLFNISAMSFGALSKVAIQALSKGAATSGAWLNTGEGGLAPYHLEGGADLVFQIGTAKYGVRDAEGNLSDVKLREIASHQQVRMFEIKLSQGAKPGKGGILPGGKVTEEIARIRGIPVGQDSISPNRHLDMENVGDILNQIQHIRTVTGKPCGFKTVFGDYHWLQEMCQEINRRGIESAPDFITIDSADGGTGAAPMALMDYMGLPLKESLPRVADVLSEYGLRDRIKLIASGKLVTSADVAWALCLGADFCQSARGFMFALGCIQALQCNKNSCPTGITTHDAKLQRGLDPISKAERVAQYKRNMDHSLEVIAHSCGLSDPTKFSRHHCRVVQENGLSLPLDEIYPPVR